MAAVTLLKTEGLRRRFGGLEAVGGVDFTLTAGEIRAVIGPNGAGKTTFVSLISGRVAPTAGTITFEGEDVTGLPEFKRVRRGIAYTFQITSVFPKLTVFDNAALAAQSALTGGAGFGHGATPAAIEARAMEALTRVDLASRREQAAGTLAYGHQRLLEVAMGLALDPKLLILDEPTQGLSDGEIEGFIALTRTIATHATVLLIEHNMKVVMDLADRITVLDHGKVLAEGTPAEIRANAAVQAAYLGGSA
ncbi:ABC transporter ATP-binding protein [Chthonobacter albigriseus]|uniref:ABC transporter ATP-binding protein n=1 Tax=Chthonobacter albigriseus TaxID=1683161 RepID=UPI0015EEF491|nr:ABC transporter ATP-binding protein [Chthonobacter albigriseus]